MKLLTYIIHKQKEDEERAKNYDTRIKAIVDYMVAKRRRKMEVMLNLRKKLPPLTTPEVLLNTKVPAIVFRRQIAELQD